MSYTHLSLGERYQIYALKGAKHSINLIARVLNRSPSTISRELGVQKPTRLLSSMLITRLVTDG
uniref:helix-turn-helix domain-containing protein n=1 Tax=Psychrobacter pacificensis TaxID=112002 RepID=UPI001918174B